MIVRLSKFQAIIMLLIGAVSGALTMFVFLSTAYEVEAVPEEDAVSVITEPLKIEVTLQKHYVDGELSEQKVTEIIWAMEDFWAAYEGWQLVDQEEGKIIFRKQIDDISPLLKEEGYFGLSEGGMLTLYSGKPELHNVIQTFFQIDVNKLEVQQYERLEKGIPIKTKSQYSDVLETFRRFEIEAVPF